MYRPHLDRLVRTRLEDVLLDEGVLPRDRVESAQLEQDQSGRLLSDVLVDAELMDEWDLAKLVCARFALPFIDVNGYTRRREVTELVPREWCKKNGVLLLDQFGQSLMLACQEIPSAEAVRELQEMTGCFPFLFVGLRRAIREALEEPVRKVAPAAPAAPAKGAAPAAASAAPAAAPAAPAKPAAPEAPSIEPDPAMRTVDLPPLDMPSISMRLDASAAAVGAPDSKKPAIQRFQRGAAAAEAAPAEAAAAEPAPAKKPASAPAAAAPPAGAPAPGPRLANRSAPVVPAGGKPGGGQGSWQSIFDVGEDNVRRTRSKTGERGKKTPS